MNQTAPRTFSREATGWLVMVFFAALVALGWTLWQGQREANRKVDAANADVVSNIKVYLPQAFATWSETVRSPQLLAPDTVYSGKASTIVAFRETIAHARFLSDTTAWDVLARSRAGTYFLLRYELCDDCDTDGSKLKVSRLFVPRGASVLSLDEAKDWLYRAGLRKEYKAEFGNEAPPVSVQG